MTLRLATDDDRAEIKRMALLFKEASPYSDLPLEEEKVDHVITKLLSDDRSHSMVILAISGEKPVGVLAGTCSEFLWNTQRHSTEIIWWMDPGHRKGKLGKTLKDAFEYWSKNVAGCTHNHMTALDPRVGKYYIKSGYSKVEESYLKVL